MSSVDLARAQFALTSIYHFLFVPLTIGLLIDISGSQARLIEDERRAAYQFFSQVLRKRDMAFLISFGDEAFIFKGSMPLFTRISRWALE